MPRLKPVDPVTATGRVKEVFEGALRGKTFNIFKAMANSPAALDFYLAMNGALSKASLSATEREVIQLAIAKANGCDYCQAAHSAIGKGAGMSEELILDARRGRPKDPKLAAVARFALALHEKKGFVTDEDVEAFRAAGYGDAALAEVVAVYAAAVFTNYFNHMNGTAVDFPAAPAL